MPLMTLHQYLDREERLNGLPHDLSKLLLSVADAVKCIRGKVSQGALAGVLGLAGTENVQGEDQKKLDVLSNEIMCEANEPCGMLSGLASEEMTEVLQVSEEYPVGPYLILFDPLDGSSNIDINAPIGTIFSILPSPGGAKRNVTEADFLQPGINQVASGYALYSTQTQLVFTLGRGVVCFTYDPESGLFRLTKENVTIPASTSEFAVNCSNMRHWFPPVRKYVDELLAGETGPRGKNYNMRWVAAMIAEVHRIINRGGIFMYPRDRKDPSRPGKLRLMYEANPMAFLVEQAGGKATDGTRRILEIQPEKVHQRVAVFLGAADEVSYVTKLHEEN